jgi:hypothetical protein
LAGKINDPGFHKCFSALKFLESDRPKEVTVTVLTFFETQWEEYLKKVQTEKKGLFFHHKVSPLIFYNEIKYIGDCDQFTDWVLNEFRYLDKTSPVIYKKKAVDGMKSLIENTASRSYVFMDLSINGQTQKVVFELFLDVAPLTCDNFKKLCTGTFTNKSGEKLTYVGCELQRVVKGMYI